MNFNVSFLLLPGCCICEHCQSLYREITSLTCLAQLPLWYTAFFYYYIHENNDAMLISKILSVHFLSIPERNQVHFRDQVTCPFSPAVDWKIVRGRCKQCKPEDRKLTQKSILCAEFLGIAEKNRKAWGCAFQAE